MAKENINKKAKSKALKNKIGGANKGKDKNEQDKEREKVLAQLKALGYI